MPSEHTFPDAQVLFAQQTFPVSPQVLQVPLLLQTVPDARHLLPVQQGSSTAPHAAQIALAPVPSQIALPEQVREAQQAAPTTPQVAVLVDVAVEVGETVPVVEAVEVDDGALVTVADSVDVGTLVAESVVVEVGAAVPDPVPVAVGAVAVSVDVGTAVTTPVPVDVGATVAPPVPVDVGTEVDTPVLVPVGTLDAVAEAVDSAVNVTTDVALAVALPLLVLLDVARDVRLFVPDFPSIPPSLPPSNCKPFELVVQAAATMTAKPITHWIGDRCFRLIGDPPNGRAFT